MRRFLFAALMVMMLVSACDTPPSNAACYIYDFSTSATSSNNTPINIQSGSGQWIYGYGLQTVNNELIFNWTETFFINPSSVSVRVVRPSGVTGDILVEGFIADAFSVSIGNSNLTLLSGMDEFTLTRNDAGNSEGKTFNATIQTAAPLLIDEITVYVDGANPFPRNDCAPATPSPTPSKTYTPPPVTVTPFQSPTGTYTPLPPTGTFTPAPATATATPAGNYCYLWDFSVDDRLWGVYDFSGISGTQNMGTYTTLWEDSYNGARGYRGIAIRKNMNFPRISRVEMNYSATTGGDTDPGGNPLAMRITAIESVTTKWTVDGSFGSNVTLVYEPVSAVLISEIRLLSQVGVSSDTSPADRGGSSSINYIKIESTDALSGMTGGEYCDEPDPTATPLPPTATGIPPTATATRTPIFNSTSYPNHTATPTGIIVATRTVTSTMTMWAPTSYPAPTNSPTPPPPTIDITLPPTVTALPTGTFIPVPSEIWDGTVTPWATYPGANLTPLPGTPDFDAIGTPIVGTLVGTPEPGTTVIPVPDDLSDFHSDVTDNLGTAVAEINTLPSDLTVIMPDISDLPEFAGYAKWLISGVSLQEIFGERIYPIPLHMFFGITAIMFVSGIMITFKLVMWFIKAAVWIIRFILKIIPFIG